MGIYVGMLARVGGLVYNIRKCTYLLHTYINCVFLVFAQVRSWCHIS